MPSPRRIAAWAVGLAALFLITVLALEAGLRLSKDRLAWEAKGHPNEPVMLEPDPARGWRNRPGVYEYPGYSPDAGEVRVTIWDSGSRATGPENPGLDADVVLLGGSFTFGMALSDRQTLAWKLAERTGLKVLNLGAGGYGTYQSLLALEDFFAAGGHAGLVYYGFCDFHGARNVATNAWRRVIASGSKRGHAKIPYCRQAADGGLDCRPPEAYPDFPFKRTSYLMDALEDVYMQMRSYGASDQRWEVTAKLMERMDKAARDNGSRLVVLFLFATRSNYDYYSDYLRSRGIAQTECVPSFDWVNKYIKNHMRPFQVEGEGHPNELVQNMWLHCLLPDLQARIGNTRAP